MNNVKTCAFSGHRMIYRLHTESLPKKLSETLDSLIDAGFTRFLSGGAWGFDLIAANAVLQKKREGENIELVMVLPCRDQAKNWPSAIKKEYLNILSCADDVIYITEKFNQFCMHLRNRRLVDDCNMLLCYMMHSSSGTGYTYNYAQDKSKTIVNLADLL